MSTPHTDAGREQDAVQDPAVLPRRQSPPPSPRPPDKRWFALVAVTVVVALPALIVGVVALTQLGRQHVTPQTPTPRPTTAATTTPIPTSTAQPTATPTPPIAPGQWASVLEDYNPVGHFYTFFASVTANPEIWSYDPIADKWSKVAQEPDAGSILAATLAGANGNAALWVMSLHGRAILYRYVI